MGNKLKMKIRINKFYLPMPAIPLSFVSVILKFSYKYFGNYLSDKVNNKISPEDIDRLINILKNMEPFELVDINIVDKNERIFIKIYTK